MNPTGQKSRVSWSGMVTAIVVIAGCGGDMAGLGPLSTVDAAFDVSGEEDVSAPTLEALSFTPEINTSSGPADVTVDFTVADDLSGAVRLSVWFFSPSGVPQSLFTSFEPATSYTASGVITFPQYSEEGTWTLIEVGIRDAVGNEVLLPTAELASRGLSTTLVVGVGEPPISDVGGPYAASEGEEVLFVGTGSLDPDGGSLTFAWTFGDGTTAGGETPTHTYTEDGLYDVCLTVTDGAGETAQSCTTASVSNATPACGMISGLPTAPVAIGTWFAASATFTDPGTADTHTVLWDWDDGDTGAGTVTETGGSGTVGPDGHAYEAAGIHTVSMSVADDDGASCTQAYAFVVVYDPSAGFITGGGWINSTEGSYAYDPSANGQATFGFVSKYRKGSATPDGNTEFQFHAAGLDFHSSSYEWLVVNQGGHNAQLKGSGTVNGLGDYRFMIWAGDDDPDTFRIRIWEEDSFGVEVAIYDNGFEQALGGGSIVIHTR